MYQITIEQVAGDASTQKRYMIEVKTDAEACERVNALVGEAGCLATLVSVKKVETGH